MKAKILMTLVVTLFCVSCQDNELASSEVNSLKHGTTPHLIGITLPVGGPAGGTVVIHPLASGGVSLPIITSASLANNLNSVAKLVVSNPGSFITTNSGGITYGNISISNFPQGTQFLKTVNIIKPQENLPGMSNAELKQLVKTRLIDELRFSPAFNQIVQSTLAYLEYINYATWYGYTLHVERSLKDISTSTGLGELEKFVLTQAYHNWFALVKAIPTTITSGRTSADCLPRTKEEWMAVAEDAFKGGMLTGIGLGIQGMKAGALATTAAGNPVAGGIVGGGLGFFIGFVGGAAASGGVKMLWDCIAKQLKQNVPLRYYTCSGKVYKGYLSYVPTGCVEGGGPGIDEIDFESVKNELKSISLLSVLPNTGKQAVHPDIYPTISWLMQYL
jgi:hypothetical protein